MNTISMETKSGTTIRSTDALRGRHPTYRAQRVQQGVRPSGRPDARPDTRPETGPDVESCYATFGPTVLRYVSRICGKEHGPDVTQDVFTAFWNSPTAFDPERGSVQSLLLTIGHRRAIDVSRQNTSRTWRDHRYAAHAPADAAGDLDSDMLRIELIDEVKVALAKLRPELREPIRIAYFEDCTYQEVAARLGLPEGTVKSRIRSGFIQLRQLLDQHAPQPATA